MPPTSVYIYTCLLHTHINYTCMQRSSVAGFFNLSGCLVATNRHTSVYPHGIVCVCVRKHTHTHSLQLYEWCCSYHSMRNSLVALLEALFARVNLVKIQDNTPIAFSGYVHGQGYPQIFKNVNLGPWQYVGGTSTHQSLPFDETFSKHWVSRLRWDRIFFVKNGLDIFDGEHSFQIKGWMAWSMTQRT